MAKAWSRGSLFAVVRLPFGKVSAILVDGDIFIRDNDIHKSNVSKKGFYI